TWLHTSCPARHGACRSLSGAVSGRHGAVIPALGDRVGRLPSHFPRLGGYRETGRTYSILSRSCFPGQGDGTEIHRDHPTKDTCSLSLSCRSKNSSASSKIFSRFSNRQIIRQALLSLTYTGKNRPVFRNCK